MSKKSAAAQAVQMAVDVDGIATVTLNRPDVHNAIDESVIEGLNKALDKVANDAKVRAVVIGGHGTSFCAGADLNWMKRTSTFTEKQNFADAMEFTKILTALREMPKPSIARVHGPAYGGGVGVAAACDIAVGTREAKFCFSEIRLGLIPAMISPYSVAAIGERHARRYMLTAEVIDAGEAFRIGLLHDIVEPEELDARIGSILRHVVRGGPDSIAACKDLIRAVAHGPVDDAMRRDTARRIAATRASKEGREGIAAFLEKRNPAWVKPRDAGKRKP